MSSSHVQYPPKNQYKSKGQQVPPRNNKPAGWFSRRHQDDVAHIEAGLRKDEAISTWRGRFDELAAMRTKRSSTEQLKVLDERLGIGQGARRERARLENLIREEKKAAKKAEKPAK